MNARVEAEIFPDVPTRCSDTRTLMRSLIYIQEVLGIDLSKMLFNKGNKMMYYNLVLVKIKLAMFDMDIVRNLFYKDNIGMTALSQNGRVILIFLVHIFLYYQGLLGGNSVRVDSSTGPPNHLVHILVHILLH